MKDDAVLAAWLIVLLRTREGSQVSYDWGYQTQQNDSQQHSVLGCVSMEKVMTGLQDKVEDLLASLSHDIQAIPEAQSSNGSGPASLILSTSSLGPTSQEAREEVSLETA